MSGGNERTDAGLHLRVSPIELPDANAFVARHHRHHKPVVGHRFSISAWADDKLVGVAIIGRPVARMAGSPLEVLEVSRLCTDGTPHTCSMLYAAAARAGKAMGYRRIQTYILETETGASLLAAGWISHGAAGGSQWKRSGDYSNQSQAVLFQRNRTDQPTCGKVRWAKELNAPAPVRKARAGD